MFKKAKATIDVNIGNAYVIVEIMYPLVLEI